MDDERLREVAGMVFKIREMRNGKLNVEDFNDRLLLQKSFFLLNKMGAGPEYDFGMYIRGPYSKDLADDYYAILEGPVDCPPVSLEADVECEFGTVLSKGTDFLEALSTLMIVADHNPGAEKRELAKMTKSMKPWLALKIAEAEIFLAKSKLLTI